MPGKINLDNPVLSAKIGIDRKRKIIEAAEKENINPTTYLIKMIDTWFEVLENAK